MTVLHVAAAPAPGGLATLHPASFALAMATGIVSIACHLQGFPAAAVALLWANVAFYVALWIVLALRTLRYRAAVLADLVHHGRAAGFFTITAATCVLGSQFVVIGGRSDVGMWLWIAGIALWAVTTYGVFTALTVKTSKPTLAEGLNGGWLVAVVAAQSVAVLGAQLAGASGEAAPRMLFFCLAMWLGGGMLYIWIISLIFYRYTFFAMSPSDLAPPYWINMGAVAISTLAGASLLAASSGSPVLQELVPFVKGLTLLFWATATWWIPMLVILGVWRHGFRKFPLQYDPLYWGAVFPLGMYTVCTIRLTQVIEVPYLVGIPVVSFYIAAAAWTITLFGLVRAMIAGRW